MSIRRKQQNTFCFRLNCLGGSTEVVQVAKAKSNNDG